MHGRLSARHATRDTRADQRLSLVAPAFKESGQLARSALSRQRQNTSAQAAMKALSNALVTPPFQTCPRPAITAVSTDQDAPAGIDIDPDRRAFLRARLNLLAFPQLKADVA